MTQYVINIGALPNDGTGDPLRTAFNETNLNFDQVFAAGPVLSNVRIANNTILTTNTNGNLVLAPNGIGVVQSNVSIVPNTSNIRNLGSGTQRWSSLYIQYANISGNLDLAGTFTVGDLTVSGNLTVTGNTIQIGNLVTDAKTIQLANTASTANAANGSGMTVGSNDDIATLLYSNTANAWTTNIGVSVVGNVTGNYFIGNGSQLTNVTASSVAASALTGNTLSSNVLFSSLTSVGTLSNLSASGNVASGNILTGGVVSAAGNVRGANFNTDGTVSATGNVTANNFIGLLGNITNLDSVNFAVENIGALVGNNGVNIGAGGNNNLVVLPTDVLIQNVPLTVDTLIVNQIRSDDSSFVTIEDGLNVNGDITADTVTTTGNITGNYFIGNGSQLTGLITNSISNGNSNVEIANANGNVTVTASGTEIWTFGTDGRLTFPGTPRIDTDANNFEVQAAENISFEANAVVNIYTDTSGTTYQWQFGDSGDLSVPGDVQFADGSFITDNLEATGDFGISTAANVGFMIDTNEAAHTWTFDTTGNLTAPGNVIFADNYVYSGNTFTSPETNGILKNFKWKFSDTVSGADTVTLQWNLLDTTFPQWYLTTNSQGNIYVFDGDAKALGFLDNSVNSGTVTFGTAANNGAGGSNDIELTTVTGNAYVRTGSNSWKFGNTGVLTVPGNIAANWLNISNVGNIASLQANVSLQIVANASGSAPYWTFNSDGNLYVPGSINGDNNGPLLIDGNGSGTEGYISLPASNFGGEQIAIVNQFSSGNGIRLQTNGGNLFFGDDGVLTAPNNITTTANITAGNVLTDAIESATDIYMFAGNGIVDIRATSNVVVKTDNAGHEWLFDNNGVLTVAGNIVMPSGASLLGDGASPAPTISGFSSATFGEGVTATGNISGGNILTGGLISATGNITSGNLISNNGVYANVDLIVGDRANASASKGRFVSNSGFMYLQVGNGTPDSTGNIVFSPYQSSTARVTVDTASGNITAVGNVSAGNISAGGNITGNTAGYAIGYRDIPQVGFTGNATIATTDAGKHFYSTESTDYILTIANNASQGFQVGAAITIVNQGSGTITVAEGSGVTLYLAGNVTAGNRTVATFGMATIMKVATDTWFINGTGVS